MHMKNDDEQIGRILTRREVMKLLGVTGAAVLMGCGPELPGVTPTASTSVTTAVSAASTMAATAVPACVVRPATTAGPYFVDKRIERSDIRSDPGTGLVKEGALLALTFHVLQISNGGCTPLAGALVDIWHCDAQGVYSDVSDPGFDTSGQHFLRGYQVTDANGVAGFTTIYPGWYPGRTVHIHFKIRTDPDSAQGYDFTSQLFFDDALTDQVFTQAPYASRGQRNALNSRDGIYRDMLLLAVEQTSMGYAATFDIGLQMG